MNFMMDQQPTLSSKLYKQKKIYTSFAADKSQIYDGRELQQLNSSQQVNPISNPIVDALKYLNVHKVHGGNDKVECKTLSFQSYQPAMKQRNECTDSISEDQPTISPFSPSRHSTKAPNNTSFGLSPPKLSKSKRRDDLSVSMHKGRPSRRHSDISFERRSSAIDTMDGSASSRNSLSSSTRSVNMRRKSEPHHRDIDANLRLSSILKSPKYSQGYNNGSVSPPYQSPPTSPPPPSESRGDFSKLLDISNHRFNLDKLELSSSLPPSSGFVPLEGLSEDCPVTSSSTSVSSVSINEEWLPKGVGMHKTMEVYVFQTKS